MCEKKLHTINLFLITQTNILKKDYNNNLQATVSMGSETETTRKNSTDWTFGAPLITAVDQSLRSVLTPFFFNFICIFQFHK
jgi:hypothetical protein